MLCAWSQAYITSQGIIVWCVCVWRALHLSEIVIFSLCPFSSSSSCHFQNACPVRCLERCVLVDEKRGNREVRRIGLWARLLAEWPPLRVDKHDSVCDRLLQPFTHTITLFIQLTDNEQADLGLFTLCICFTQGEIRVSLPGCGASCMCSSSVYKTRVIGSDGGIVCPRPDAFRMDV